VPLNPCFLLTTYEALKQLTLALQVRLLVEIGAADPSLQDRWQQTPLQEATRSGAAPLVGYLSGRTPVTTGTAAAVSPGAVTGDPLKPPKQQQQLPELLQACSNQDSLQTLAQLGSQGRLAAVAQLLEQQLSLVGADAYSYSYGIHTLLLVLSASVHCCVRTPVTPSLPSCPINKHLEQQRKPRSMCLCCREVEK
jgi:hypothetical protein